VEGGEEVGSRQKSLGKLRGSPLLLHRRKQEMMMMIMMMLIISLLTFTNCLFNEVFRVSEDRASSVKMLNK
jgi:hypothetical protein